MRIQLRLHASVTLPEPAMSRELALDVDEDATVGTLLGVVQRDHPRLFPSSRTGDGPTGRLCLFAGPEHLNDSSARLRDALRSGRPLSLALLRPITGG